MERSTKHPLCTAYKWWFALYCKAQSCFWQGPPVYNSQVKMSELIFLELPFVHSKRFWLGMHSLDSIVQTFFFPFLFFLFFPFSVCSSDGWLSIWVFVEIENVGLFNIHVLLTGFLSSSSSFSRCVCVCARCFSFVYSTFWLTIRILVMSLLYKWSWWWWWFEPLQTKRIRI